MMSKKKSIGIVLIAAIVAACAVIGYSAYLRGQIHDMREAGKAEAAKIVQLKDYRPAQQAEIKKAVARAAEKIDRSENPQDVDAAIVDAKADVKDLKTDAQLTKEEQIRAAKERARKKAEARRKARAKKRAREKAKKEAARRAAQQAAAQQAAAAQAQRQAQYYRQYQQAQNYYHGGSSGSGGNSGSASKKSSGANSEGCVGDDARNFY